MGVVDSVVYAGGAQWMNAGMGLLIAKGHPTISWTSRARQGDVENFA